MQLRQRQQVSRDAASEIHQIALAAGAISLGAAFGGMMMCITGSNDQARLIHL